MAPRTAELKPPPARLDNVAAQLARSEERLRLIMDAIPALIAYVDSGERYRFFANKGYADWFGLDKRPSSGASPKSSAPTPTPRSSPWNKPPPASRSATNTRAPMPPAILVYATAARWCPNLH